MSVPVAGNISLSSGDNVFDVDYIPSFIEFFAGGQSSDTTTSRTCYGYCNVSDLSQGNNATFNNSSTYRGVTGNTTRCVYVLKSDGTKWVDAAVTSIDNVNSRITIHAYAGDSSYPIIMKLTP